MDQKVHPHGLGIGVVKDWDTKWYASKRNFIDSLIEDNKVRESIKKEPSSVGISKIEIKRAAKRVRLSIHTAKPDIIVGKGGAGIEALKARLTKITDNKNSLVDMVGVKNAKADTQLVAESIAAQLEKRVSFRRVMRRSIQRVMRLGAKGVKTACSGGLGGAKIAKTEQYYEGTIPLQTLRADIDYGFAGTDTTYGRVGVKVWVYSGEILSAKEVEKKEEVNT